MAKKNCNTLTAKDLIGMMNAGKKSTVTVANKNYKTFTVRDLMFIVCADKKNFPLGLDTPIASGDFEGNYHHIKHEVMADKIGRKQAVFLGYEMHENDGE